MKSITLICLIFVIIGLGLIYFGLNQDNNYSVNNEIRKEKITISETYNISISKNNITGFYDMEHEIKGGIKI